MPVRAQVYAIAGVGWLYRHITVDLGAKRRDARGGLVAQVRHTLTLRLPGKAQPLMQSRGHAVATGETIAAELLRSA